MSTHSSDRTPPKRPSVLSHSMSEGASKSVKRFVIKVDPNQGRCLVTNVWKREQQGPIQQCHIIPRNTKTSVVTHFEVVWGLNFCTLHLDTRYNIIPLTAGLHGIFDTDPMWMLLPHPSAVDLLYVWFKTKPMATNIREMLLERTTYDYYFVPQVGCTDMEIVQVAPEKNRKPITYPCLERGPMSSHAHPHFAVIRAGSLLVQKRDAWETTAVQIMQYNLPLLSEDEAKEVLNKIVEMYCAWTLTPITKPIQEVEENAGTGSQQYPDLDSKGSEDRSSHDDVPDLDSKGSSAKSPSPSGQQSPSHGSTLYGLDLDVKTKVSNWIQDSALPNTSYETSRTLGNLTPGVPTDSDEGNMEPTPDFLRDRDWDEYYPSWPRRGDDDVNPKPDPMTLTHTFSSNDHALLRNSCLLWTSPGPRKA